MSDSQNPDSVTQEERLRALEIQLIDCANHIQALEAQRDAILNSSSWRLTSGLRLLTTALTNLKLARRSERGLKAFRNLIPAIDTEIKRHGLKGVLLRTTQYFRNFRHYMQILGSDTSLSKIPALKSKVEALHRPSRVHAELVESAQKPYANRAISVVIPTLNAGNEFRALIKKLKAQELITAPEIIIIDSGSTDHTVQIANEYDCKVIQIPSAEFSHSGTRNLGAEHATGEFLLFMVQDAYPIGDQWLYGMLTYLIEHLPEGVVAVSCSEFSRSDSDMMYDCMINTHYQFLECLHADRVGKHLADDHMSLRSQGQLSDVSCLISRSLFQKYRYQGSYAEDLDLGIRLIKDGYKVAMLASTKVIHSHNRPPYYYLKRTFVDVLFLVQLFKDFPVRPTLSLQGLLLGIVSAAKLTNDWLGQQNAKPKESSALLGEFTTLLSKASTLDEDGIKKLQRNGVNIDNGKLDALMAMVIAPIIDFPALRFDKGSKDESRYFFDAFLGRIRHFSDFASPIYPIADDVVTTQLEDVVRKTLGASIGAALSFAYLGDKFASQEERAWIERLHLNLKAGV